MKILYGNYPDLMVCSSCFQIYGFGGYISPRREYWRHWQNCDCSEKAGMPKDVDEKWTWFDFNKLVELCYCCGKVLIPSGSKWNFFFCDECKQMVRELNRQCGRLMIPVGRHSIVNGSSFSGRRVAPGYMLSGEEAQDDQKVEGFLISVKRMAASIKRLNEWSRLEVANTLKEIGRVGDIPLLDYRLRSPVVDRPESFRRLVVFFEGV